MEVFVDCAPIEDTEFLVFKRDRTDNTFSLIGFDDPHELAYCGVDDIRDFYSGVSYGVFDDEGTEYEIIRLK